ncbi:MAG TPA: BON domain-containing protein [Ktedonobacterales bacterium]
MAEFTTVRKIRFGSNVLTNEGERGTLAEVVIDAQSGAAVAVGVRFGVFGRLAYTEVGRLIEASDREARVDVARSEMPSTPPAGARVTSSSQVTLDGKRAGRLTHITFDGHSYSPLSLVVSRAGGEYAISASSVKSAAGGVVVTSRGGGTFTAYHTDGELREDVRREIERYARIRVDMGGVDIQAVDGVIWLRGYVSGELNRQLVGNVVGGVGGVSTVHNELITDPELAASISAALARDPATAEERIGVYSALGRVSLRGAVRSAGAREAAARIAAGGFVTREISNDLRVDPRASVLPVLAGVTNNEDDVPGGR